MLIMKIRRVTYSAVPPSNYVRITVTNSISSPSGQAAFNQHIFNISDVVLTLVRRCSNVNATVWLRIVLLPGVRRKDQTKPWFGVWVQSLEKGTGPTLVRQVQSLEKGTDRTLVWQVRSGRKDIAEPYFGRFRVLRKERTIPGSAGSEFRERTWSNPVLAGLWFGERTGPNPGSAGSELGERKGQNPDLAGLEFGEKTGPNPGFDFGFGVRRKERAKPWFSMLGAWRKNLAEP